MLSKRYESTEVNRRAWSASTWPREKERFMTQSDDKCPFTNRTFKKQRDNTKRHQKLRLHNNCEPN